jgi:hypothetical protein
MIETRYDSVILEGLAPNQSLLSSHTILTERATRKQITTALKDKRNFKVSVYQPGAIVERKGRQFRVSRSGRLVPTE